MPAAVGFRLQAYGARLSLRAAIFRPDGSGFVAASAEGAEPALVAGAEGLLIARILDDQRALERLFADIDVARHGSDADRVNALVNEYNTRLDKRVAREWLLGG